MREIRCRKCRQHKPVEYFSLYNNGMGLRHRHTCRACRNEYQQEIRANDGVAPPRPEPTHKFCTGCDQSKSLSEFSMNGNHLGSRCKDCRSRASREWWDKFGKTRGRDKRLRWSYGLSAAQYDALLAEQGGGCAICGKQENTANHQRKGGKRMLCVDHCHETEMPRGILCATCNNGLGCFKDDPKLIHAALAYLSKYSTDAT